MVIEAYTEKHREEVLKLVDDFYAETIFKDIGQRMETASVFSTIEKLKHHSFLLIINKKCVGFLAGVEVDSIMNSNKLFHQVIWFVHKSHRSKSIFFFKRIMRALKAEGYHTFIGTLLHDDKLNRRMEFFKKMGFKPLETHLIKTL